MKKLGLLSQQKWPGNQIHENKSLLWWNERANLLAVVAIDKANSTSWNTEIPLRYKEKNSLLQGWMHSGIGSPYKCGYPILRFKTWQETVTKLSSPYVILDYPASKLRTIASKSEIHILLCEIEYYKVSSTEWRNAFSLKIGYKMLRSCSAGQLEKLSASNGPGTGAHWMKTAC